MVQKAEFGGGKVDVRVFPDGTKKISARLFGYLFKEDNTWISVCPPLDISTCGDTQKQAVDRTAGAIRLFFEACLAHGTLDKALHELNWVRDENIALDGLTKMRKDIPCETPPAFQIDRIKLDKSRRNWTSQATLAC